jgi:type II secretory pathway pseudopilin PulG
MIELLVVVAVTAILAMVAAPSFNEFILKQRLKGVTNQIVTDLQFARAEAASRNLPVWVRFGANANVSCYTIFVGTANGCSCTAPTTCTANGTEVRTVSTPVNRKVRILIPTVPNVGHSLQFEYDPTNGGIRIRPTDDGLPQGDQFNIDTQIDEVRRYRIEVKTSGRPGICKPTGSTMDAAAC